MVLALALIPFLCGHSKADGQTGPAATIGAIGADIAKLKKDFPQLGQFSPADNVHPETLIIEYSYHTHRSQQGGGGWTAGVPHPADDGIWFFIDFHSADSVAQIDTQPSQSPRPYCLGDKRLTWLILEGRNTKPASGRLWQILRSHGVKSCANTSG